LPVILSKQEVARLIAAACTPLHRILLMTLYATGARNAELTHLKVSDIDSQRMVVHIQGGKGREDRLCAMAHKRSLCREKLCALDADGIYGDKPPGVIVLHITICL
jgi:site-specific recombinase XerD